MVLIRCISSPIKSELDKFFEKKSKDWINLSKLSKLISLKEEKPNVPPKSLPPEIREGIMERWRGREKLSKKEMEEQFEEFCLNKSADYLYLKEEFNKVPSCHGEKTSSGTIRCIAAATKSDICAYLNSYARRNQGKLSLEATMLADALRNNVPQCTDLGNISPSWLKKRGIKRDDLMEVGNILQIAKQVRITPLKKESEKYIIEWEPPHMKEPEYDVESEVEETEDK